MPTTRLARDFARWMLPLAAVAALAVAAIPPLTYRIMAWRGLAAQASLYAGHIAASVRDAVYQQPELWRYNADKILEATFRHQRQADIASIVVRDCSDRAVFASGSESGAAGWTDVAARGQTVARVIVRVDPSAQVRALWTIALICVPLGLGVGALLFLFPLRVVRRQGSQLARDLSRRVVQTQEEERRRIARDLHDSLGQAITGLQMDLELARARPQEATARLQDAIARCRTVLDELRRVVQELRPLELQSAPPADALRAYTELFERRTGITCYFHSAGDGQCPEQAASCLLRLLQEGLTNVQRHAQAAEVGVKLSIDSAAAELVISDDGCGFDVRAAAAGVGLRGMRERCELFGGQLEVSSQPGAGTRITARLRLGDA